MKNSQPKLKLSDALFKGSFVHNPVLTQIIGICPIVAAATKLREAFALSVALFLLLAVNEVMASLLLKGVKRWLRVCVYTLVSAVMLALIEPLIFALAGNGGSGLGIYYYLLCVNALVVIRCERFACRTTAVNSFYDAASASLGYGAVALIVGAVRELLNYGTLFSSAEAVGQISQRATPFAALVILGFLAAGHKWLLIKFYPDETRDAFSLDAVFEKPVKKDPGIFARNSKPKKIKAYDNVRPSFFEDEKSSREGGGDK